MKRPLIFFVAAMCAALFAACYLQGAILFCAFACAALIAAGLLLPRTRRWAFAPLAFTLAAGVFTGAAAWQIATVIDYAPAVEYGGASGTLVAYVADYPDVYENYTALTVIADTLNGEDMRGRKIYLYIDGAHAELSPGDSVTVNAELSVPESNWNFDKLRYYRSRRIYLTADADEILSYSPDSGGLRFLPIKITRYFTDRLAQLMPADDAAVLDALIFGDERGLDEEYVAQLRATGLSHITAVSGMNVSFLVGLLLLLFRRRLGSIIAVPVVLLFMLMTGGSASVVRAGIMQLLWLTAYFIDRESDPVNSLFAACGIILLCNPFAVSDVGLWLSFAASLGLLTVGEKMRDGVMKRFERKPRAAKRVIDVLVGAFVTTIAAQIFVLPIQIAVFGNISLIAPLANVAVVPSSEYAFTGGVVALLLSFIWMPLGRVAAWLPRALIGYQRAIVPRMAALPMASVSADNVYIILCVVFLYALALLCLWRKPKRRVVPIICAVTALFVCAAFAVADRALTSGVTFADTAGGQSVVAYSGGDAAVINCGGSYPGAANAVTDALSRRGTGTVALFVLTDYRTTSAGNAETLMDAVTVQRLLLPPGRAEDAPRREEIIAAARARSVEILQSGEYTAGEISIRTLANAEPGGDEGRLAVYLGCAGYRVLSPGGIYPENLGELLYYSGITSLDAVAAGDYYAANPLPPSVLNLKPELCVFSSYAGADRDALSRAGECGAVVAETERGGYIESRFARGYTSNE